MIEVVCEKDVLFQYGFADMLVSFSQYDAIGLHIFQYRLFHGKNNLEAVTALGHVEGFFPLVNFELV